MSTPTSRTSPATVSTSAPQVPGTPWRVLILPASISSRDDHVSSVRRVFYRTNPVWSGAGCSKDPVLEVHGAASDLPLLRASR